MTRIAHLTDLHFGATDPRVVAALSLGLRAEKPDLVVVSGDLTQGARRSEFRAARAFLDGLDVPVLAVPGNHDITPYRLVERFFDPYRRWREEVAAQTEPLWHDDRVAVIGLNTARRAGLGFDWSLGRVTRPRLARLLARLDALPASLVRIVVAHHPLLPQDGDTISPVAGGAERALAAFAAHGVSLVLAGHLHRSFARLAKPDGPAPLILQGGSATSTRLRGEPNAYNRLVFDAGGQATIEGIVWDGSAWSAATRQSVQLRPDSRPKVA